jgi:serine phosphatase RsbU (regulator of sigma subunit)
VSIKVEWFFCMKHLLLAGPELPLLLTPLQDTLRQQGYQCQALQQHASLLASSSHHDGALNPDDSQQLPVDIVLVSEPWLAAMNESGSNPWVAGLRHLKSQPHLANALMLLVGDPSFSPHQLKECVHAGLEGVVSTASLADSRDLLARLELSLHHQEERQQTQEANEQLIAINTELYDRNLLIENELYNARQLQQSLLPLALPETDPLMTVGVASRRHVETEQVKVSGLYLPCDSLGGDLYDVMPLPDGMLGLTMADVSGHGLPAGFVTALFKSSLYRMTHTYQMPHEILYHLNNELCELVRTGDYITGLYCRLLEGSRRLQFAGAGHPYPVHYQASTRSIKRLEENGPPLIWMPDMEYAMLEVDVAAGDKILLFTDGVSEMQNLTDELYGEDRLESLFCELAQADPEPGQLPLLDRLLGVLSEFTEGASLKDDLSMVLIEIR